MLFFTPAHAQSDHNLDKQDSTTILVLGDSLSAAYGLQQAQGWVALLQNMFNEKRIPVTLINAAISGETTDGGLSRLPRLLETHSPDIVYIELGGNDGLQGHSITKLRDNLRAMVTMSQAAEAQVWLQAMQIPTNYGRRYNSMFIDSFAIIADEYQLPLLPFFLQDIALQPELMMPDGIHPTAEAQPLIAQFMFEQMTGQFDNITARISP